MKELASDQAQAVEAGAGPVLIVAGPGTGKTKTLTARIAHLIETGVPAGQVLALTFTNKAAREMAARVKELLPDTKPLITTFHGLCHRLLADAGQTTDIIPEPDRQTLLRNLKKSHDLKGMSVRELALRLSRAKNAIEPPADPALVQLLELYNHELATRNLFDFDDLLQRTYQLLKTDQEVRLGIQKRFSAILVDEFQDTNLLQYELLRLLNRTDNLFVIGDPLQAIYGFRGARADIFERFLKDWPKALQVRLTTNYRSTPEIVALSGAIFPDTPPLRAYHDTEGHVQAVEVLNEYSEADWIIRTLEQEIGGSTMLKGSEHHTAAGRAESFRDFAVLYRTHATAKALRRQLDESGIPYQVAGEGSPYEKPEVKTILEGLAKSEQKDRTLSQHAETLAHHFGLKPSPELRQFINSLSRFDNHSPHDYLKHVELIAEQEFYDPSADAVTLLTIHAAKGLEFKHIFLIGAEEGLLPHYHPGQEPDLAEERRLFYVAVTRARDLVDILHARKRGGQPAEPSRFLKLDETILPHIIDPEINQQIKRIKKRAQKRAQTSLF
jgi:superfamily I DNA/RNA helicase